MVQPYLASMIHRAPFMESSGYLGQYFTIYPLRPSTGQTGHPEIGRASHGVRAHQYGGAPNMEPGTRDDGILLRAGAGMETSGRAA